jgi:small acid-soluble spore protein I (minor)
MIWTAVMHNESGTGKQGGMGHMGILLDLRQAIMQRVTGKSEQELAEVIEGSIGGDDRALPGLGVLFEIIWQNIDEDLRQKLVQVLHEQVKPA